MMHVFGMSFGFLWMFIPVAAVFIGLPLLRNLIRRTKVHGLSENSPRSLPPGDADAVIYRLAKKLNGRLTVSDVIVATGMSSDRAEQLLQQMVDGLRVRMEVSPDGLVIYEFVELMSEQVHSGHDAPPKD